MGCLDCQKPETRSVIEKNKKRTPTNLINPEGVKMIVIFLGDDPKLYIT